MDSNTEIKFTREHVSNKTLPTFNGDKMATDVWINKYCLKDSEDNLFEETPDDMHWRLAKELARIETKYPNPLSEEQIYKLLKDFKYIIPGGGSMSGIGNNKQIVSLSNCFVIGNGCDSYGGITYVDQEQVQLMKRRGGVGHDLSHIRPKGSPVKNSALTSTGVVPFMERYSNSTKEVAQDGRRGALMLSLSSKHPDVNNFIDAKLEDGKVTNANVSVRVDDEFMKCIQENRLYQQQYPVESDNPETIQNVDAGKIWKKIIHNAWKSAEPGVLFWDNVIAEAIPDVYGNRWKTVSTNPCGEIPLCPYDSCRLLAVNLYSYVENPFTSEAKFNYELFKEHVGYAQRLMDDIIDLELEKIDQILTKLDNDPEDDKIKAIEIDLWENIKEMALLGRRTGLGITAEGDMLAAMGLRYGTDEGNDFSEEIHKIFKLAAYRSSVEMAKERGAFELYNKNLEENNPFIQRIKKEDPELYADMVEFGRRNMALLTIAPTGTVSLMTQTTSGVEPVFLPIYKRRRKINPSDKDATIHFTDEEGVNWTEYNVFHHKFKDWLIINGYDPEEVKVMDDNDVDEILQKSPYYKATSADVDWVKKVEMQGRIQKHIDHSISVTVNLPENATEELVGKVYEAGWKNGCKGITIYRDGSRSGVLISNKDKKETDDAFKDNHAPKRPKRLKGEIHKFQNNLEKWIAVVGINDGRPYEIFTGRLQNGLSKLPNYVTECEIVKNIFTDEDGNRRKRYDIEYVDNNGEKHVHTGLNHTFNPEYWNYAKLISSVLRHGMPMAYVHHLIRGLNLNDEHLNTWKAGVERIIKRYIKDGELGKGICDNCGAENSLIYQEGCLMCKSCGHSKCG